MNTIDNHTLMAYLDGELDEAAASEVEALIESDTALEAKVQDFRQSDALLRAAFNHVMLGASHPVPAPKATSLQQARQRKVATHWATLPTALAASLAILLIGGVSGFLALDTLVEREFERRTLLKEKDSQAMIQARANALEKEISGTKVSWSNPDTGNSGSLTPVQTWRTKTGRYCREFQESITIGGATSVESGVACRTNDGLWKVRLRYYPE